MLRASLDREENKGEEKKQHDKKRSAYARHGEGEVVF